MIGDNFDKSPSRYPRRRDGCSDGVPTFMDADPLFGELRFR